MAKKTKKKVKYTSPTGKTWAEFTRDAVDEMANSKFVEDNSITEIEVTMTKTLIKDAADDILAGMSRLEVANKYGLEEEDMQAIFDAVMVKKGIVNS